MRKQCKQCQKKLEGRNKTGLCKDHVKNRRTHGMCKTPTYGSWCGLKERCLNVSNPKYKYYGGRGIEVCDRWLVFENFFKDMGLKPKGKTIDRINNNGNYEKSNCMWANSKIQGNNKRDVVRYKGKNLSEWDKELGFCHGTVRARIKISGWSWEKAVSTPKFKRGYKIRAMKQSRH